MPVNLKFAQNVERKKTLLFRLIKNQKTQQILKLKVLTVDEAAKGRKTVTRIWTLTLTLMGRMGTLRWPDSTESAAEGSADTETSKVGVRKGCPKQAELTHEQSKLFITFE